MRVTLVAPAFAAVALLFVVLPSSCAGCSEECRDTKQGSEGCPCSTDQDCTTRLGEVLLCGDEGVCGPADPPDAPAEACDNDGDCGDGELCGLGLCSPAPACQRIDTERMRARERAGATLNPTFDAAVSREGCNHEIVFGNAPGQAIFELIQIHPRTGALIAAGDCTDGAWFAGMRAGVFQCGTSTVIVSVREPCFTNVPTSCAEGTCVAIGSAIDEDAGVCQ
jgi:hypothetical protein